LSEGAVYVTVTDVAPALEAVPIVGAAGTFAAMAAVEFEFARTAEIALVAVTTQRIV
jgi:hypothetical protein